MANQLTDEGIAIIKRFEGFRSTPYRDPVGVLTIGYGHRIIPGLDNFTEITEEQATGLLLQDAALKGTWVLGQIHVPLNDNQYSALVSLVYNEGVTPLTHTLGTLLNAGDYEEAAGQFDRWVYAGGEILPGLVARRAAEKALFLTTSIPSETDT